MNDYGFVGRNRIEGVAPMNVPKDAYGPDYIEHCLRENFEDLRRFVGFERAREIMADVVNDGARK